MKVSKRVITEKEVTISESELLELLCDESANEVIELVKSLGIIDRNKVVRSKIFNLVVEFNANVVNRVITKIFKEEN